MQEFNHKRAWLEWIKPNFDAAYSESELFRAAWNAVVKLSPDLVQCSHALGSLKMEISTSDAAIEPPPEMVDLSRSIDRVALFRLGWIVNNYGHWAPNNVCSETSGATWKFEKFANQIVFKNGGGEDIVKAKAELEARTKLFYDHKPGTTYDGDDAVALLANVSKVKPAKHVAVNFRVDGYSGNGHPFCIGGKHMALSQGMYLDPTCAPCAECGYPYSAHHHDMALLVTDTKKLSDDELKAELKKLLDFIVNHNASNTKDQIKVDGFGLYDRKAL